MKLLLITLLALFALNSSAFVKTNKSGETDEYRQVTHLAKSKMAVWKSYYEKEGDEYKLKREKICEQSLDVPIFGNESDYNLPIYSPDYPGLNCEFDHQGKKLTAFVSLSIGRSYVPTINTDIDLNADELDNSTSLLGWISTAALFVTDMETHESAQEFKLSFDMSATDFPASKLFFITPSTSVGYCEANESGEMKCPEPYFEAVAVVDGNFEEIQK